MGKNGKKDVKGQRAKKAKTAIVNDLPVKDAKAVKGGNKSGGTKQDYLVVTLKDVLVS